jgi:4-hydroxythreonine-4-phosphate dehydrogenase
MAVPRKDNYLITLLPGDGIGPEIIVKAFAQDPHATRGAFVVGDVGVLRRAVHVLDGALRWPVIELENAAEASNG